MTEIQNYDFYVAIKPYKVEDNTFDEVHVSVCYNYSHNHFYVSLQPGWKSDFGHGCVIMGDQNPLTASTWVKLQQSPKNSQKTINLMGEALEQFADLIALLFNQREWVKLERGVKNITQSALPRKEGSVPCLPSLASLRKEADKYIASCAESEPATETNNQTTNNQTKVMNTNVKAADLIGKEIIVGNNVAKYIINAAEGDTLKCDYVIGTKAVPMPLKLATVTDMVAQGKWTCPGIDTTATNESKTADTTMPGIDVPEESDIAPVVTMPDPTAPTTPEAADDAEDPKGEPDPDCVGEIVNVTQEELDRIHENLKKNKPTDKKPAKKEAAPKQTKTKTEKTTAKGNLTYKTYKNKKDKVCAKIMGFREDDAAYKAGMELHGSASYETVNGERIYALYFGPRYAEAAKQVCEALNAGKSVAEAKAIIDSTTEERAKAREEWKAKRAEYVAKKEATPKQTAKAEKGEVKKSESAYTAADVAAMLKDIMAGADIPEDIKKAMKAA